MHSNIFFAINSAVPVPRCNCNTTISADICSRWRCLWGNIFIDPLGCHKYLTTVLSLVNGFYIRNTLIFTSFGYQFLWVIILTTWLLMQKWLQVSDCSVLLFLMHNVTNRWLVFVPYFFSLKTTKAVFAMSGFQHSRRPFQNSKTWQISLKSTNWGF